MKQTILNGRLGGPLAVIPSKSASHRAVLMAALAQGETILEPLQLSHDISATLDCIQQLGYTRGLSTAPTAVPGYIRASILGRAPASSVSNSRILDCGDSGSTLRFLIPLALDGRGPVRFVGRGRLMQRPLTIYEDIAREQNFFWQLRGNELSVEGRLKAGTYSLPGNISSQFITGLLLALPLLSEDSAIILTTPLESRGYVDLTRHIQAMFGIQTLWEDDRLLIPGRQVPRSPRQVQVESDWSHAAFYLVAGTFGSAPMTLYGLDLNSPQGDKVILDILTQMGADIDATQERIIVTPSPLHAIEADVSQCPDLVPVLAVAMAAAHGESRITGAARLRLKESDRLRAVASMLQSYKSICYEQDDGLIIRGGLSLRGAEIDGWNDHRIVMAAAIASGLCSDPVTISDAEAVTKSAPAFWDEFKRLGGILDER